MNIVVDANIFVSGYIWSGLPFTIIERIVRGLDVSLISDEIISEIEMVFKRPKFKRDPQFIQSTIAQIKKTGKMVVVPTNLSVVDSGCRDPKDILYIKCAVAGNADYIISGDKHLRELQEYHGIRIVTAREYLDLVGTL